VKLLGGLHTLVLGNIEVTDESVKYLTNLNTLSFCKFTKVTREMRILLKANKVKVIIF